MLGLIGVSMATPATAEAAVIAPNVFTDDNVENGNCTLREAIRAANLDTAVDACPAGSGADTVQLQAETHTLTVGNAGENRTGG